MSNWKSIILAIVLSAAVAQPGLAQAIPSFWDAKQRLAKPDVSTLQRLRFLTTTDFFPFNFLDEDGRLNGFHVDLARAICRELDMLSRCQIQAIPFDELEGALEHGDGEAVIAGLAITRESRETFLFSHPYLAFPARFVARREIELEEPIHEAVKAKKVGVVEGTAHERMLGDLFAGAQAVAFSGEAQLTTALAEGKIDAAFGDGMRFAFWLAQEGKKCCAFAGGPYLAPEYLGQGLAIAVPQDQPALAQALDYALQQIDADGTFAELYLRYFPISFY
ncbi:transporter substrate-binding domain-containing protein [Chelativorans sp. AA-79]|uniref:transporter substrate-binding domain-containing protein n=1 Tax=Chelativorans sp. AA-79 TaxID=3028735 RepID=UPI0023F6B538|nr:transporter substrate-binding domain-containing protein [Chelativorans sp. AA-79]WEX09082.1 transporter substrate-binding domain-containing protein [Chelativorans sp. AA-79]